MPGPTGEIDTPLFIGSLRIRGDVKVWAGTNEAIVTGAGGGTPYTAGDGMTLTGTVFSVHNGFGLFIDPTTHALYWAGVFTRVNGVTLGSGYFPYRNFVDGSNLSWNVSDGGSGFLTISADVDLSSVTYTAGDGLALASNVFSVVVADIAGSGLADDGLNNLRLADIGANTLMGRFAGTSGAPGTLTINTDSFPARTSGSLTQLSFASFAGNGLTYSSGAIDVGGSTSIIVGASDVQRAALTGFVSASQNSNATTSSEPIITFAASSNMSNERVLSDGDSTSVDLGTAGQAKVNYAGTPSAVTITGATSNLGTIDISALKCGGSVRVVSASSAYSIEGFTAKSDGFWFDFLAETGLTNHCTLFDEDATATAANRLSLPRDQDMSRQGQIRGRFTYRNSRWNYTGANQQVIGLNGTNYAGWLVTTGDFEIKTAATNVAITAGGAADVNLTAGNDVNAQCDALRLSSSGGGGFLILDESSASTPSVTAGKGMFWVKNDAPNVPMFTGDDNVDHELLAFASQLQQEAGTNNTVSVTPAVQQFHPSAAKAWCLSAPGSSILASYNITSATDTTTGKVVYTIATDFSSSAWVVAASQTGTLSSTSALFIEVAARAAGSLTLESTNGSGTLTDPVQWEFVGFGDQ